MEKKKGKLFVISGSSGVGKGTLLNLLLKQHPDLKLSISATTRKPRPGEVDGVNYFFTDKQEFLKEVENGPLGGNRKGAVRTYWNLFAVFLVTGI